MTAVAVWLLLAAAPVEPLSYLKLDLATGRITGEWDQQDVAAPIGSLEKPFLALAWAQQHGFRYPVVTCPPRRCWLPRGHGQRGVEQALAQSCNVYFEALRRQVSAAALEQTARRFGLASLQEATPNALLRAYAELLERAAEPGVGPLLAGLRLAATEGTAKGVALDAYAKTGTAPCRHHPRAPGDGFAIVLYPAAKPRLALLARLHGRPGSHAAQAIRARGLLVR